MKYARHAHFLTSCLCALIWIIFRLISILTSVARTWGIRQIKGIGTQTNTTGMEKRTIVASQRGVNASAVLWFLLKDFLLVGGEAFTVCLRFCWRGANRSMDSTGAFIPTPFPWILLAIHLTYKKHLHASLPYRQILEKHDLRDY